MYPALSTLHHRGDDRFWDRVKLGFRWLAALAFPVLFFVTAEGGRILTTVYQSAFIAGVLPLQILVWGQGLDFFCPFAGHVLYVLEKQKKVIIVTGASVATNVAVNLILIPLFGIIGAACAMVISLGVMLGGYLWALHGQVKVTDFFRSIAGPLAVATVTAPLIWVMKPFVPFVVNGLIYVTVYLAVLFSARVIRFSDLKLFSSDSASP